MSKLVDKHAHIKTDLDAILSGKKVMESTCVKAKQVPNKLVETITSEADLLSKLRPLSSADIYSFMSSLHNGTFFNMGTYKEVPLARAYKKSYNIYRVLNSTAIVTGSGYENLGTTKDYRAATGAAPASAWYEHEPGYENKIGRGKSNPNNKYILWNAKKTSGSWVAFYLVDLDTRAVTPISGESILHSDYITNTEKKNLGLLKDDEEIIGWDATTCKFIITKKPNYTPKPVSNETVWRTSKFENVFWLSQKDREYGAKFEESFTGSGAELEEGVTNGVRDLHAGIHTDLDAILSGSVDESLTEEINAPNIVFIDITGSNTYQKELEAAAIEDGHEGKADWYYTKDTYFSDVLSYASQGKPVFFYTADDDYTYNCPELADMDNVTIKQIKPRFIKESYRRTVSRGLDFVDNELFVDFD